MKTIYIESASKKQVNVGIKSGKDVGGIEYNMLNCNYTPLTDMVNGDVIKLWSKRDPAGTPIAKSYGQFKNGKII